MITIPPIPAGTSTAPVGGATEAKQDAEIAKLSDILAKLSADPATQTTLAAILAKIIAAPATEAKQDAAKTALDQLHADLIAATPAGENHIGQVGGTTVNPTDNFTRPADTTQYASGDLVANSTTAGSVTPGTLTVARIAGGSGMLRRIKLHKSGTSVTSASFRVHFFRSAPSTITNGDNGVFSVSGVADYIGAFDVTLDRAFTDGACGFGTPIVGTEMSFKLASGTTLRYLIEARGTYTPANAEVFTVTMDDLQD